MLPDELKVIKNELMFRKSLQATLCQNAMVTAHDLSTPPGETTDSTIGTLHDLNNLTAADLCARYDVLADSGQLSTCAFFMVGGRPQDAQVAIQQRLKAGDIEPVRPELLNENGMPRNRRELQPEKLAALPQKRMQVQLSPDAPPGGLAFYAFPCDEAGTDSHVAQHAILHAASLTDGTSPLQALVDNNVVGQLSAMPSESPSKSVCLFAVAGGGANTLDKHVMLLNALPQIQLADSAVQEYRVADFNKQKQLQASKPLDAMKRLACFNKPPSAWNARSASDAKLAPAAWERARALLRCGVCCVAMQGPAVPQALPPVAAAPATVNFSNMPRHAARCRGVPQVDPKQVVSGASLQLDAQSQGVMAVFACPATTMNHEMAMLRVQGDTRAAKALGSAALQHEAHANYLLVHFTAPKSAQDFGAKLQMVLEALAVPATPQEHVACARKCSAVLGSQMRDGTRINVHAVAPHILPVEHPLQLSPQDKFAELQRTTPETVQAAWDSVRVLPVLHFSYNTRAPVNDILANAGFSFTSERPAPLAGVPVPSEDFTVPTQAIPAQVPTTDFAVAARVNTNAHEAARSCVQTELGGNCFSTDAMRAMRVGLVDGAHAMHVGPLAYGVQCGKLDDALFVAVKTPQENVHNVNKAITSVIDHVLNDKLSEESLRVTQDATWNAFERNKATPKAALEMLLAGPKVSARKQAEMLELRSMAPRKLGRLMARCFCNNSLVKVAAVPNLPGAGLNGAVDLPRLQRVARMSKRQGR